MIRQKSPLLVLGILRYPIIIFCKFVLLESYSFASRSGEVAGLSERNFLKALVRGSLCIG